MITLLTDFGTLDYYVGAMKGVILSTDPNAMVVDITHEISPHDIEGAAFVLLEAYGTFPAGTIHLVVIDPGVGSDRRPIVVESDKYIFVGPDNGLFSHVYERESNCHVRHLTNEEYFRRPVSATFQGRDLFAPVAGALSRGVLPAELGEVIEDYYRLPSLSPQVASNGIIEARIIHIDRFGNCVTNLTQGDLTAEMIDGGALLQINGHVVKNFRRFFSDGAAQASELFAVWGSAEFLEIAAFSSSAAELLGVERGQEVLVKGLG